VNVGDVITLRNKNELARENNVLSINFAQEKNISIPEWLRFDPSEKRVEVFRLPTRKDIELSFDPKLIIEFYSR
jgi:ribosomal protein S4